MSDFVKGCRAHADILQNRLKRASTQRTRNAQLLADPVWTTETLQAIQEELEITPIYRCWLLKAIQDARTWVNKEPLSFPENGIELAWAKVKWDTIQCAESAIMELDTQTTELNNKIVQIADNLRASRNVVAGTDSSQPGATPAIQNSMQAIGLTGIPEVSTLHRQLPYAAPLIQTSTISKPALINDPRAHFKCPIAVIPHFQKEELKIPAVRCAKPKSLLEIKMKTELSRVSKKSKKVNELTDKPVKGDSNPAITKRSQTSKETKKANSKIITVSVDQTTTTAAQDYFQNAEKGMEIVVRPFDSFLVGRKGWMFNKISTLSQRFDSAMKKLKKLSRPLADQSLDFEVSKVKSVDRNHIVTDDNNNNNYGTLLLKPNALDSHDKDKNKEEAKSRTARNKKQFCDRDPAIESNPVEDAEHERQPDHGETQKIGQRQGTRGFSKFCDVADLPTSSFKRAEPGQVRDRRSKAA